MSLALTAIRANACAFAAGTVLCATGAPAADLPLNGITIGLPVAGLARTLGTPAGVSSDDAGNRFEFSGGTAVYADDDGIVLAAELRSGVPRVDVDGIVRAVPIGAYSTARADAELAAVAEYATPARRSYRLAPRRDLVLEFDPASGLLERVTYGEPGQLARLGLLPGDAAAKAVDYRAPRPRGAAPASPAGPLATVLRVAVDRTGGVRAVDVVIASTDAAADTRIASELAARHYIPAALDGRPIAAAAFVEVRH